MLKVQTQSSDMLLTDTRYLHDYLVHFSDRKKHKKKWYRTRKYQEAEKHVRTPLSNNLVCHHNRQNTSHNHAVFMPGG